MVLKWSLLYEKLSNFHVYTTHVGIRKRDQVKKKGVGVSDII